MAGKSIQIAFLCASLALLACCVRLGVLYNGWAWAWASLALVICAAGILTGSSRARRVGFVAASAAFVSGLVQGSDQNLPFLEYDWEYWPLLAAFLWSVGVSYFYVIDRYWREMFCALPIACIYIYEQLTGSDEYRGLIEIAFALLLLPSGGGVFGKFRRHLSERWNSWRNRDRLRPAVPVVAKAQEAGLRDS